MEVGDYVRTKNGGIGKVVDRYEVNDYYKVVVDIRNGFIEKHKEHLFKKYIKVSSPNIIDLIEVGDIIINQLGEIIIPNGSNIDELKDYWKICKNPIKSILTKEQFESMEYKVD